MASKSQDQTRSSASADLSGANASSDYLFGIVMLGVAALIPWYFELPLIFDVTSPDFNPLIALPIILAAIGVVMTVKSARAKARARTFGQSTLAPQSGRVGSFYRGTILTARDLEAKGDYRVTLSCIRRTRSGSDSDESGSVNDRVLHKESKAIPAATKSSLGMPVEFALPKGLPRSGQDRDNPNSEVRWIVEITAPTQGVNYYASFSIQVS